MNELSDLARRFINQFQGGFPLTEYPYSRVAAQLGTKEATLISTLRDLLEQGVLSRFGPLFNADALGGAQTLAALSVPEERFSEVAEQVNALSAVAHNYRREHRLNMWFVVAAGSTVDVESCLKQIESCTGLQVFDFPKLAEYFLGLWLHLRDDGSIETVKPPPSSLSQSRSIDELDLRIVRATQTGLPLVRAPYAAVATSLNMAPHELITRLKNLLSAGVIRRIGAVPNHYRLGLRGNGMTVWDVPNKQVDALGRKIGALSFVSHCYRRPRHPGFWPYNLFAMVHGRERAEVLEKSESIARLLGTAYHANAVLFSSAVLKKTGLRLARKCHRVAR